MDKLLAKSVKFMYNVAMFLFWTGLIAWCLMFAYNQWKIMIIRMKTEVSKIKRPLSSKKFYVIEGNK